MTSQDGNINLELIVTQLNINEGYNEDLKEKCPELFGYAYFVSLVRQNYAVHKDIEEAVSDAIDACIKNDILSEFFKQNRKEVAMMGLYEFDEELHNRTLREEGYEDGFEDGREKIIQKLLSDSAITPEYAETLRQESTPTTAIV